MLTDDSSDGKIPTRKHPAHGILFVDGQPTIIFDTVCTKDRARWMADDAVHQLLREIWREADAWRVGRYMIMPDHVHFFAAATGSAIPYENWVRYCKSQFTKRHKVPEHRWLTDHWDVRVRDETAYEEKSDYMLQNPMRAGLVTKPEDWPWQGVVYELSWK